MTRKMYTECKLVHADLSEYNILYHVEQSNEPYPSAAETETETEALAKNQNVPQKGHLYIIDVSQSVEHDHPHAFDFLRADLRNVEEFFGKRGVQCVGLRRAFDFVTRDRLVVPEVKSVSREEEEEALLYRWMEEPDVLVQSSDHASVSAAEGSGEDAGRSISAAHEDSVFMRTYIPRTLNEVIDPERDVRVLNRGEGDTLIYKDMIAETELNGDTSDKSANRSRSDELSANGASEDEDEEDVEPGEHDGSGSDEDGESETGDRAEPRQPRGHRHEDREVKKVSVNLAAVGSDGHEN